MKIAVQLFGHLRTYDECFEALHEHLLSRYECDVFMHTWSTLDHATETWHKHKMSNASAPTNNSAHELKKNYKLKELEIEHQILENLGAINAAGKDISIFGIKAMFHSMKRADCLRRRYQEQTDANYDFVVVLRPDVLLKKDFILEDYIKSLSEAEVNDTVFTTGFPMVGVLSDIAYWGATDVLFFAKPYVLTRLFDCDDLFLANFSDKMVTRYGPEKFFIDTIKTIGFSAVLIKYLAGDSFEIIRPASMRSFRRSVASVRIRREFLKVRLLSLLSFPVVRLHIDLGGVFSVEFSIGTVVKDEIRW